jgi:rhodanese-related sulfurtransferase
VSVHQFIGWRSIMKLVTSRWMKILYGLSIFLLSVILYPGSAVAQDSTKHVTAQQAKTILEKDSTLVVLDVRTPEEFKNQIGRLPRAINIPVQEFEKRVHELEKYRSREILVYCRSGNRSMRASAILLKRGFKIIHLDGGILQWNVAMARTKQEKQ